MSASPIIAAGGSQTLPFAAGSDAALANKAKRTEHAGPKKGRGAYYGRKREAKRASARRRREDAKRLSRAALGLRHETNGTA